MADEGLEVEQELEHEMLCLETYLWVDAAAEWPEVWIDYVSSKDLKA